MNDKYTINPMLNMVTGNLKAGDLIDMVSGDTIVGPYCVWPLQEPRIFVISWSKEDNGSGNNDQK